MEENRVDMLKKLGQKQASFISSQETVDLVQQLVKRVEQLENLCAFLTELVVDADAAKRVNDLHLTTAHDRRQVVSRGGVDDVPEKEKLINGVSLRKINEFVEELLERPTTNFGWIPDALERRIDRRLLQLVLGVIAQTVSTAAVKVGDGHELTFSLRPQDNHDDAAPSSQHPRNMDVIVFTALKSILESMQVEFFGHALQFHLQ